MGQRRTIERNAVELCINRGDKDRDDYPPTGPRPNFLRSLGLAPPMVDTASASHFGIALGRALARVRDYRHRSRVKIRPSLLAQRSRHEVRPSDELRAIARFIAVGCLNTGFGYGAILIGLFVGLNDYAANLAGFAIGLPVSYAMHRRLTFRAHHRQTKAEAILYATFFFLAYGCNLAVIAVGRKLGFSGSAVVQLAGVLTYSVVFFVALRLIVFREAAGLPRKS